MVDLPLLIADDPYLSKALAEAGNAAERRELSGAIESTIAQESLLRLLDEIPESRRQAIAEAGASGSTEALLAKLEDIFPDYEQRFLKIAEREVRRLGLDVSS